jgi:3-hydroxyisobutyrate dehydrogenase/2-hydroxy-3-oxopropionate reductase
LLHNALGMIHAVATCEVVALCLKVGIDPLTFIEIVREAAKSRGVGYSTFFDMHAEDIVRGREQGAGRLYIAAKDAHLAHDLAKSMGFAAPLLAEADRTFAAGMAAGLGDHEYTAIIRIVEQRAASRS